MDDMNFSVVGFTQALISDTYSYRQKIYTEILAKRCTLSESHILRIVEHIYLV